MNFADILGIAFSALSERRLRTGLTILMVLIGVTLITSINGLNAGTSQLINEQFNTFGANLLIISSGEQSMGAGPPQETSETPLNDQTLKTLSRIKWVDEVIPNVRGAVTLKKGIDEKVVTLIGLDQSKFIHIAPTAELLEGKFVPEKDFIGILLGYNVAFEEGIQKFKAGQNVIIEISKVELSGGIEKVKVEKRSYQVKGVLKEIGNIVFDQAAYLSLPAAETLLDRGDEYDSIYLTTEDSQYNDDVEADIREIYGKAIGITSPEAIAEAINTIVGTFTGFISAIAFISLIVGAVGIITTLFTSVLERTREVGLLKALGFTRGMILSIFIIESMLIGALGGTLGMFTGIGGAYILGRLLPFQTGAGSIEPLFRYFELFEIWIVALVLSIISGMYPAWRASKLSPLEALRKE
jgi:putative ABC transport system permease protein